MRERSTKNLSINISYHNLVYIASILCFLLLLEKNIINIIILRLLDLSICVDCQPHLCNILGTAVSKDRLIKDSEGVGWGLRTL